MTEQEAKLILDVRISRFDHANDVNEALEVAKSALEEIQQYREFDDKLQMEIGITVKELYEKWNVMLAKYLEYQQLGTVEELREATEKQVSKEPIKMNIKWQYRCPCCNNRVTKLCPTEIETMNSRELFCSRCGQAIDWS